MAVGFVASGRCGNFLFECATALAYSLKHGLEFTVPARSTHQFYNPTYLHHLINKNFNPALETVMITERQHNYQELPFDENWRNKNILLSGYWQTEKYFKEYREEILKQFNLPWHLNEGVVSVHNRRGDYLRLTEKHPYVGEDWIEKAMAMFPGKKFLFFSDEIEWAKSKFGDRTDCFFSEGNDIMEDLVAMSCCEHQINSSSTYSFWGAWLNQNPNKIVVTPRDWFTAGWDNCNTEDIVPPEWIKL